MQHKPVLLDEVLTYLNPEEGKLYVDATFGFGGYSKEILDTSDCNLIAFDQDPDVITRANEFKDIYGKRFNFVKSNFVELCDQVAKLGYSKIDGIVFDLGVSSMQLDQAERGFSFQADAELDMRMSQEGMSARDVVNDLEEEELASIIYRYGDERYSRRIARAIIEERKINEIVTTKQLAELVYKAKPFERGKKIDPATKTFQAIRIFVNDELAVIENVLNSLMKILAPNAKLVVVNFHSLEDRILKEFLLNNSNKPESFSRYVPEVKQGVKKEEFFKILTKRPITAGDNELKANPRARSAKLRAATWIDSRVMQGE